jgi:hypothetical protein
MKSMAMLVAAVLAIVASDARSADAYKVVDMGDLGDFTKAMIDGVSAWRFAPVESNAMRAPLYTYTINSMSYVAQGTLSSVRESHAKEVSAACVITDFMEKAERGEIGPRGIKVVSR